MPGSFEFISRLDPSALDDTNFKEDSVREVLLLPLLNALGYTENGDNKIHRSVSLVDPWLRTGSKRRPIRYIPDYILSIKNRFHIVIDAKSPKESVINEQSLAQAYGYAIHPEVRAKYFGLFNGRELIIYDISDQKPAFYGTLHDVAEDPSAVLRVIGAEQLSQSEELIEKTSGNAEYFDYTQIVPPKSIVKIQKQVAKRHHGVHGYFTKQVYSVVQQYIKTFTREGDVVLDPFGGGGAVAIESWMTSRKSYHIDINPLSTFIVSTLLTDISVADFTSDFERVVTKFEKLRPKSNDDCDVILKKHSLPENISLPPNSDVRNLHELYSIFQLAELALLRHLIAETKNKVHRDNLLLMFSSTLNKINLTYHSSGVRSEGRGDSSVFRYYRYRIAPRHSYQDTLKVFTGKLKRLLGAKHELGLSRAAKDFLPTVIKCSASNLPIDDESIDYIYTDPPYGAKINYLDLSTMWNAWLGFTVTDEDFDLEVIEGGSRRKTNSQYRDLMTLSLSEMFRVLKFDRWMSFVFAHKDPRYWHLIVDAAERAGFEYVNAVRQNNGQSSFKKRQNPFKVLQGQLIINFRKPRNPRTLITSLAGADVAATVKSTIDEVIAENHGATIEEINDALIIRGLEEGFLHVLSDHISDTTEYVKHNYDFDSESKSYFIRTTNKLGHHIDLQVRAEYYVVSYLRNARRQGVHPTFDDIVLNVMPLLKYGITPDNQTIISILQNVAHPTDGGRYELNDSSSQFTLDLK